MEIVYFATQNRGKLDFVKEVLESRYQIEVIHVPLDLSEIKAERVEDVAMEKARVAFREISDRCIAIDSGLFIPSLKGYPSTDVNKVLEKLGIEGLLKLMEGKKDRSCEIRPCLAYFDEGLTRPIPYTSRIHGTLSKEIRGGTREYHWSDLARIFVPAGHDKTEGEMTETEYNKWRIESDKTVSDFGRFYKLRMERKAKS